MNLCVYKKIFSVILSCFVFSSAMSFVTFANNHQSNGGFATREDLIQYLDENGVSLERQEILINKLEKNQDWDVYNPEKIKLIPEDFYIFDPTEGSQTRYYRFEDGSFIKIESIQNDCIDINGTDENMKKLRNKVNDQEILYKIESELDEYLKLRGVSTGSGYAHYYDHRISYYMGTMSADMIT